MTRKYIKRVNDLCVFSAKGMCEVPRFKEHFRVGCSVGVCLLSTPWFVIMKRRSLVVW